MKDGIQFKAVIRDVVIIWILIALAAFVVGVIEPDGSIIVTLSFPVAAILGFTISGCITIINRWKHLLYVAVGVWLVMGIVGCLIPRIINSYYVGTIEWLVSVIIFLFLMGIGGGLSCLFVRGSNVSEVVPENDPIKTNDNITGN